MLDELVKFFVVLLVVVEPLSLLPILAGLTEGSDDAYRRRMSCKAVAISAGIAHDDVLIGVPQAHTMDASERWLFPSCSVINSLTLDEIRQLMSPEWTAWPEGAAP